MKALTFLGLSALTLALTGCKYRGAVYSEYNQTALDIRAQQASSSPIKVNFGYDRGVVAYVPKRNAGSNTLDGEAVSVIAWNNLQHNINPFTTATNGLLQVDAGFISGVAAVVATAPADAEVVVVPVHDAVFETMAAKNGKPITDGNTYRVKTSGSVGNRLAIAVKPIAMQDSFSKDNNGDILREFWKPDGTTIDASHAAKILTWMDENGINTNKVPITMFMRGQIYTEHRKKSVADLKLR